MFVVQIALLIVTFLSLISQILPIMQTTKEVKPHPCIAPCVDMWSVTFLFLIITFFIFLCHLLNVGACIRHIAQEGVLVVQSFLNMCLYDACSLILTAPHTDQI